MADTFCSFTRNCSFVTCFLFAKVGQYFFNTLFLPLCSVNCSCNISLHNWLLANFVLKGSITKISRLAGYAIWLIHSVRPDTPNLELSHLRKLQKLSTPPPPPPPPCFATTVGPWLSSHQLSGYLHYPAMILQYIVYFIYCLFSTTVLLQTKTK